MCGILGSFSQQKISGKDFSEALNELDSRGPDDEGYTCLETQQQFKGEDTVENLEIPGVYQHSSKKWFGNRRLAITGGKACHQPMNSENHTINFEGEIYNYKKLRKQLKDKGHSFNTEGDTEVFLHAFKEWGLKSTKKMEGKWAAAIYNKNKDEITLLRDHFGTKPLYYHKKQGKFIFSTQITPLLKLKEKPAEENKETALDYLNHALTDHTEQTFFKEIKQLRPGQYLKHQDGEIKEKGEIPASEESGELKPTVKETVKSKLPESEWCITLSGGLDSSIAATILSEKSSKTFSLNINQQKFEDKKYREKIKEKNSLEGEEVEITTLDLIDKIPETIEAQEEPTNILPAQAQYTLFQKIAETDKKAVITGSGADELFYGYPQFIPEAIHQSIKQKKPKTLFNLLIRHRKRLNLNSIKYLASRLLLPKNWGTGKLQNSKYTFKTQDYKRKNLKPENLQESREKQLKYHWYPSLLRITDKNAANFGLETREAFLSQKLHNTAKKQEPLKNFKQGQTKKLLRNPFQKTLPQEIIERKDKVGFLPTNQKTTQPGMKNKFLKLFKSKKFQNRELIKSQKALVHLKKGKIPFSTAYRLYCYETWKRKYIDK
jgi:asparagine synthase (glutamine-hydrolysing)